jgi:hypothetical protein
MNMMPDEGDIKVQIKGQTVMKWDTKKKRYVLKKVDRDSKVIKEKRNESGAKIDSKKAEKKAGQIYKKWQSRTHLRLQRAGEIEDSKSVRHANSQIDTRKMMNHVKSRHKDLF